MGSKITINDISQKGKLPLTITYEKALPLIFSVEKLVNPETEPEVSDSTTNHTSEEIKQYVERVFSELEIPPKKISYSLFVISYSLLSLPLICN